jgi:DNA-binding MltR family transcriptional regulator
MAKRKARIAPSNEHALKLFQNLDKESDRAVALLSAAYLDELLRELLTLHFHFDSKDEREAIFSYGQGGPLADFSARIKLCRALKLITKEQKLDLDQIRNVRNTFAHFFIDMTFDDQEVAQMCTSLILAPRNKVDLSAREMFIKSAVRLVMDITLELNRNMPSN